MKNTIVFPVLHLSSVRSYICTTWKKKFFFPFLFLMLNKANNPKQNPMNYFLHIYYQESHFSEGLSVFHPPLLVTTSLNLSTSYYLYQVENWEGKNFLLFISAFQTPYKEPSSKQTFNKY